MQDIFYSNSFAKKLDPTKNVCSFTNEHCIGMKHDRVIEKYHFEKKQFVPLFVRQRGSIGTIDLLLGLIPHLPRQINSDTTLNFTQTQTEY